MKSNKNLCKSCLSICDPLRMASLPSCVVLLEVHCGSQNVEISVDFDQMSSLDLLLPCFGIFLSLYCFASGGIQPNHTPLRQLFSLSCCHSDELGTVTESKIIYILEKKQTSFHFTLYMNCKSLLYKVLDRCMHLF